MYAVRGGERAEESQAVEGAGAVRNEGVGEKRAGVLGAWLGTGPGSRRADASRGAGERGRAAGLEKEECESEGTVKSDGVERGGGAARHRRPTAMRLIAAFGDWGMGESDVR